jgi:hypothetical protein
MIEDGLALVRRLWDHGLAHRDVKPANLLVVDGTLQVIDVSGLEIRPSPWREAVDLANMMLVLALRSEPERVYEHALTYFTADDVGEAFAAAQGMAIPTELQRRLRQDDRDLIARFKELAPPRPRISIQRLSASGLRSLRPSSGASPRSRSEPSTGSGSSSPSRISAGQDARLLGLELRVRQDAGRPEFAEFLQLSEPVLLTTGGGGLWWRLCVVLLRGGVLACPTVGLSA